VELDWLVWRERHAAFGADVAKRRVGPQPPRHPRLPIQRHSRSRAIEGHTDGIGAEGQGGAASCRQLAFEYGFGWSALIRGITIGGPVRSAPNGTAVEGC
jgi:hypothetical protein